MAIKVSYCYSSSCLFNIGFLFMLFGRLGDKFNIDNSIYCFLLIYSQSRLINKYR